MQSLHDRVAKLGGGLDCSGLTMTSYGEAGLHIPLAAAQQTIGAEVPSIDQLLPGERLWSGYVAMVIGDRRWSRRGTGFRSARSGPQRWPVLRRFYPADRLAHPGLLVVEMYHQLDQQKPWDACLLCRGREG
jgi:hypothetical protein